MYDENQMLDIFFVGAYWCDKAKIKKVEEERFIQLAQRRDKICGNSEISGSLTDGKKNLDLDV